MTTTRPIKISIKKANDAFTIAVCKLNCQKTDKQIDKCINEEGSCLMRTVFTTMINK
jgi:hypothetical protein